MQAQSPSEPLFPNPKARSSARWSHHAMQAEWRRACAVLGVKVGLYEGTKHSRGTALLEAGARIEDIQHLFGHRDIRSTEKYAKLRGRALVHLFKPETGRRPDKPKTGSVTD